MAIRAPKTALARRLRVFSVAFPPTFPAINGATWQNFLRKPREATFLRNRLMSGFE